MIRYLKYIFLIFGSLALAVMGFFAFQNKKDLKLAWNWLGRLDYDHIAQTCPEARKKYYYPCFREEFGRYLEEAGLTGVGIGLKLAFNFMDEDKESVEKFDSAKLKDVHYALNYMEVNNMAIDQSWRRFYGFENLYGGYLSSLREFLDGAKKFSDNLVAGLEGEKGLSGVEDPKERKLARERFERLKNEYGEKLGEARNFVENEIERFLKKAE